jgi:hypothetical protein
MNKVNIFCWAHNNGENILGDCFENFLWEELKYNQKKHGDLNEFKLLFDEIEKSKQHPQDVLNYRFRENVTLDFEFAKQLRLHDVLCAECFSSNTEIGRALINLIVRSEIRFILFLRYWNSTNEITVEFELSSDSREREVFLKLRRNQID